MGAKTISCPGTQRVWLDLTLLSLTVQPISPATISLTFSLFLPATANIWEMRSLLPFSGLTRSMPSVSLPDMTLKYDTSPRCCSRAFLKMNMAVGPLGSQGTEPPSLVGSLSPAGEGATLIMNSMSFLTPMSFLAEMQNVGMMEPCRKPRLRPFSISSRESSPASKYFSIRASSLSAAISVRAESTSSAWALNCSGMSASTLVPLSSVKVYIFMVSTSMKPLNPAPTATGNCTRTTLLPKASLRESMVFSQLAFSASSWLTATTTGFL